MISFIDPLSMMANLSIIIFLEKSYTKCDGETSSGPFSGKLNLSISLDQ